MLVRKFNCNLHNKFSLLLLLLLDINQQSADLMKVKIKILDHNACFQSFVKPDRTLPLGIKEESQFCAGDNSKDTCQVNITSYLLN